MRVAALVFGILGGLLGLAGALFALGFGGLLATFDDTAAGSILAGGLAAVLCAAVGIVGGALALGRPGTSAILQALAALGGLIAVWMAWIPASSLLGLGTLLALVAWIRSRRSAPSAA